MSPDETIMQPAGQRDSGDAALYALIDAGAKLVVYQYVISLLVVSFKRRSGVKVIRPGQSRLIPGLPYTVLSLFAGIWGIFGFIWTIEGIVRNCKGGIDLTPIVQARRQGALTAPAAPSATGPSSSDWQSI